MTAKTSYDGTRIFKPVPSLEKKIESLQAIKETWIDTKPETYHRIYAAAEAFLQASDMLTPEAAARRQGVSKAEFIAMADRGEALLIELEGKQYVPACSFGADGKIDPLKVDIAREFVLEGMSYFKFMDYIRFMTQETADVTDILLNGRQLQQIFNRAGLGDFHCGLTALASMNQLADGRHAHPAMYDLLVKRLNDAVTHGGWDPSGGLSRPFRDKYGIPGQTIHEERMAYIAAQDKKTPNKKGPSP